MSSMELDQTALKEADAKNAANKADKEIVDSEGEASDVDELVDIILTVTSEKQSSKLRYQ